MKKGDILLKQVGETTEGSGVYAGVYRTYETGGIPLDILVSIMCEKSKIPSWIHFYQEAEAAGMKHKRIMSMLDPVIVDSFGTEFRDEIVKRLEVWSTLDIEFRKEKCL